MRLLIKTPVPGRSVILEWEPNERDAWVADAENWICQINGVRQCKIDLDRDGEVTGIHVVAGMEREPRHLVRDVEGMLKARLGISVFYKKIGVVQVVDNDNTTDTLSKESDQVLNDLNGVEDLRIDHEPTAAVVLEEILAPRIQCNGVGVLASDQTIRAEVELQAGLVEARGIEEGPNHADSDLVLVGRATVDALRQLLDEPILLNLSEVRIEEAAGQRILLVAVEIVEGRRSERLFGTCPTLHNRQQAVVYAILDALNRRLSLMTFKSGEEVH
jgi:hypothetical protein